MMRGAKTIIIMEDEVGIRTLLAKTFKRNGYNVTESAHGEDALAQLRDLQCQGATEVLMILDLLVPGGMGGEETLSKARAIDPNIKAIIASGQANDGERIHHSEPGLTQFLPKPYTIQDLITTVEALF